LAFQKSGVPALGRWRLRLGTISAQAWTMQVFFLAELRSLRARGLWLATVRFAPRAPKLAEPFQSSRAMSLVRTAIAECQARLSRTPRSQRGFF
jgi:hypothetical protein